MNHLNDGVEIYPNVFVKDYFKNHAEYEERNVRPSEGFMVYLYDLYALPGPNVPLHWHDEVEIMLPKTDGVMILDGKKIDFKENDILFINSRQLHNTYHIKSGWSYHILIHPDLFGSNHILDDKTKIFYFPEKISSSDPFCFRIIEDIIQLPRPASDTDKLFIVSKIFEMLFHLMNNGYSIIKNEPETTPQTGYIKAAVEYIDKNIRQKILIQDIAHEIGISKEYLMRLFKLYTGETINSYIQIHRLEKARNDLNTGASLTDIIYKYDYSDTAYFCRLFKKKYGITPGQFANRLDK